MRVSVPVYHFRKDGVLYWHTVGIGPLMQTLHGRSDAKLERQLASMIKRATEGQAAARIAFLELTRGIELRKARLDVSIRGERGKRRKSGVFPVIVEPRDGFEVVYHPARQEEWLALDAERSMDEQLASAFGRWWGRLTDEEIDGLTLPDRAGLRLVSFNVEPPSLLDTLESKRSLWDDLRTKEQQQRKRFEDRRGVAPAILRKLAVDMTVRAAEGTLEVGRPRQPQRAQLQQLLLGARKQSTVLVGPSGAGKRTLIRRAISDLLEAEGYEAHRNLDDVTHVWSMTGSRLIAGMSHVGDWEQRCVELVEAVAGRRIVLWIEDLHTLGRVGQSRDSTRSVADFLRGPLARGAITVLGSCTPSQWRLLEHEAPAFADVFTSLDVSATGSEETLRMLLHEARLIELELGCTFDPQALGSILELGTPLIPDTALPGKALELLRRVARLRPRKQGIDTDDVIELLSERTGLPEALLSPESSLSREEIVDDLAAEVIGQPVAVDAAADLVLRIRGAMTDPERPYGTFLFTGPTGTGKTQLAKALAEYLYGSGDDPADARLVRFDMGELSGPDAVSRLIGHRWHPRGLLTEAVRQQPFCVLLLDEIEKAHPSVLYLLLQLLDEGRLTDAAGDQADFTHAVVIMTSNLGARSRPRVGFGEDPKAVLADVAKAVRDFFPPELFNRIERVVPFEPLSDETAARIADKELAQHQARRGLADRNVFVFTHRGATERMAREAFDPRAGARSVKRYLETRIGTLLAEHLASTARPEMEIVRIFDAGGEYRLTADALVEAEPDIAEYTLSALLDAPTPSVAAALPEALRYLDSLREEGGALEKLSASVQQHLAEIGRATGEAWAEHADAVFVLDQMRLEIDRFREHLDTFVHAEEMQREADLALQTEGFRVRRAADQTYRLRLLDRRWLEPPMPRLDKSELLAALAEVSFLRRLIARPDLTGHSVKLELTRVGAAQGGNQLFWALLLFYAAQRGEVLECAARTADGRTMRGPLDEIVHAPEAAQLRQTVLHIAGIGAREYFAPEHGCHVWSSVAQGSQVVRVRVLDDSRSPADIVDQNAEAVAAFEAAMERGAPTTDDPSQLLPVARRIRFDTPRRPGELADCEIEDYRLAHVVRGRARALVDLLPTLFHLRMSRAPEAP